VSDTIITVENLSKLYHLGRNLRDGRGFRHIIEEAIRHPVQWLKNQSRNVNAGSEEFWALKNVEFEIKKGEVVGIIGRNGAGKSTLLKILSRITEPTTGRISIKGRVASLLEVGTGFHVELTGRENIFLNGAILGMSKAEITRKFDEIVAFSEIEKFLDTPVKRYSSGMYVRLAFAVAAHLEPEILIVDEVLAVGDAAFQKKCLGKMREVSRSEGRTVLFVSHNITAVMQLTTRGIVLDKGRVGFNGPTEQAVEHYTGTIGSDAVVFFLVEKLPRNHGGNQAVRFVSFRFNRAAPVFSDGENLSFVAKIRAAEDVPELRFSLTVHTAEGAPVGSCFGAAGPGMARGTEAEIEVSLPTPRLAPGHYYCSITVGKGDPRTGNVPFDVVIDTLTFEVRPEEDAAGTLSAWHRGWGSVVLPNLVQHSSKIANDRSR
jgi:homopolymeric O-antigen transport system ATP-binding protein